jgi:Mor family transcriptional regulator
MLKFCESKMTGKIARNKKMGDSGGKQHYLEKSDKARNHTYYNNIYNKFHGEHWNDAFRS